MFDDALRTLKNLDRQSISISIQTDERGYIDKQCPYQDCEFLFKVHAEDWTNIFRDEAVWCPMCRHQAPAKEWFTVEQVEHATQQALKLVKGKIHNALVSDAESFNRRQSPDSFIKMSMKVSGGRRSTSVIPASAAEAMQLEIQCDACQARYAVIGSAFFCPACGHNSVVRTYTDALTKIQLKRDSQAIIRQALTVASGKDSAEITCRSLLESCISDGVVAFQRYCESLYSMFGDASFNAFQRLDQGNQLWASAVGVGYTDWLDAEELSRLKILFQKRHLLAHNEGIVDDRYIAKSGDFSYKEGQRIVITERDVGDLLNCLTKLGRALKAACENHQSNTQGD